jgi:8-oxo-dGTP pyrophosphatase MutT (NUDIX family)
MSTASSITHISAITEMVESYLEHFVDEKNNLQTLSEQLDGGDLTLTCRSNMIGHLTASALVLRRKPGDESLIAEVESLLVESPGGDENRLEVLLIHHRGLNRWLQPGGHLDSNEDPEAGARRELVEETGLVDIELLDGFAGPGSVFDIDSHLIPANAKKSEGSHLHHDFQYIYRLKGTVQMACLDRPDRTELGQIRFKATARGAKAGRDGPKQKLCYCWQDMMANCAKFIDELV